MNNQILIERHTILKNLTTKYFGEFLTDDKINEICYNGESLPLMVEDINGNWSSRENKLSNSNALAFADACAATTDGLTIDTEHPILSTMLISGERIQIVIPPAVEKGFISITIRKPSKIVYSIDDYINNGSILSYIADLLKNLVQNGKNLVICGETGSGKTTFMKTLVNFIPQDERLISIEDTRELFFTNHINRVYLIYPSDAKADDSVTSAKLLKSCLRMKPSRILLAELRGGETYDFLNVLSTGHGGSMTSCHAGSVKQCQDRLIMMAMQNDEAKVLGKDMLRDVIAHTIDAILVFKKHNNKRMLVEYMIDNEIKRWNDEQKSYHSIEN